MADVVVIGGGLAGAVVALEARRLGAEVALASRSWGMTALSSGALDIAYSPALSPQLQVSRTIGEHMMDIVAHRPHHPYGVLGLERSVRGVRLGFAAAAKALSAEKLEWAPLALEGDNRMLPSSLGSLVPAASAAASHWGFEQQGRGTWGIVQLRGDSYFSSARAAAGLCYDGQRLAGSPALRRLEVDVPATTLVAMARRFDSPAERQQFAQQLAPQCRGLDGILVSPVLGLERHAEAYAHLQELLGLPIVEVVAHVPSVPGMRLQMALEQALQRAGVRLIGEIVASVVVGEHVHAVCTKDQGEVPAGAFVLASGRFVGGGVRWQDGCRECLFGLPLVTELGALEADSPDSVVRELPCESQPLLTAGLHVGADLRPLREGRPAFINLFASGMVIGGFASRYTLCADGVALATGALAAEAAVAAAG
jgi:glycerol-3-phosphate dehydrogenase subunit B